MKDSIQKVLLAAIFLLGTSVFVGAQSVDDAGAALNKGINYKKQEKYGLAAKQFKQAIELAQMAGPDAFTVEEDAKKQLPLMYFKDAAASYQNKKYLEAAEKFKKAAEVAKQYNRDNLYKRSARNVPALYNAIANSYRKKKEFDKAQQYFDKAIEYNDGYAKAYLGKLLIYKSLGESDKMIEMVNKIQEINPNGESARNAVSVVQTHYLKQAKADVDSKNFNAALEDIKKYNQYGTGDAQGFYLSAVIYNKTGQYEQSADFVNKALAQNPGSDLKSNIFFELGNAYANMGKKDEACQAYQKALDGPSGKAAKYQMEQVLKCK